MFVIVELVCGLVSVNECTCDMKTKGFVECFLVRRREIEATLDRLKKLERDLSTKEQELKERERRLKMWEKKLIEQSNTPVSPLSLSCFLSLFTSSPATFLIHALTSCKAGSKCIVK